MPRKKSEKSKTSNVPVTTAYATVNGLKMYYEVHGSGMPLVLLHGGVMNIKVEQPLLSMLAQQRQVITVELEGHGRTADLDRPLRFEQMSEDIAGLLVQLGIPQADFVGYSMGGQVALGIAINHPELVRKLVVISAGYDLEGFYPAIKASWPSMTAANFAGTPMESTYKEVAPDPEHFPIFVEKIRDSLINQRGWTQDQIKSIQAPTLLVVGDADLVPMEYAVSMFRLLGGAPTDGGMGALPKSQFATLPGTTHFGTFYRVDLLFPMIMAFLDPPAAPVNPLLGF